MEAIKVVLKVCQTRRRRRRRLDAAVLAPCRPSSNYTNKSSRRCCSKRSAFSAFPRLFGRGKAHTGTHTKSTVERLNANGGHSQLLKSFGQPNGSIKKIALIKCSRVGGRAKIGAFRTDGAELIRTRRIDTFLFLFFYRISFYQRPPALI